MLCANDKLRKLLTAHYASRASAEWERLEMVRFMMFVFIKLKSIRIEFPESIGAAEMHKSKRNFDDEWRMAGLDATHQRFSFTLE